MVDISDNLMEVRRITATLQMWVGGCMYLYELFFKAGTVGSLATGMDWPGFAQVMIISFLGALLFFIGQMLYGKNIDFKKKGLPEKSYEDWKQELGIVRK
jgi:hypothetical protein